MDMDQKCTLMGEWQVEREHDENRNLGGNVGHMNFFRCSKIF